LSFGASANRDRMHGLLKLLQHHGVPSAVAKLIVVVALFAVASILGRLARLAAQRIEQRSASRPRDSPLVALARRETGISLITTSIRYLAFLIALTLAVVTITGARGVGTIAGASFLAVIIGFAAQRFLIDLMAGFVMFFEGWYTIGSTIIVEPWKLEGVVEEVSLRATTIRDVSGEVLHVHNSQILAVRVLPEGSRRVEIELFVRDREAGEALFQRVGGIVPTGPTAFADPPRVRATQQLDGDLYRVTAEASVAPGRLWLVEDLLPSLLRERAPDGLIVHGPVVLPIDEQAVNRFARAERLREPRVAPRFGRFVPRVRPRER
jgi:Mechanosensitive ion channel